VGAVAIIAKLDAWQALPEDDPDRNLCVRCYEAMEVDAGFEPSALCHCCAQDVVGQLADAWEDEREEKILWRGRHGEAKAKADLADSVAQENVGEKNRLTSELVLLRSQNRQLADSWNSAVAARHALRLDRDELIVSNSALVEQAGHLTQKLADADRVKAELGRAREMLRQEAGRLQAEVERKTAQLAQLRRQGQRGGA
jgi:hypothetical protein